MDTPLWIMHLRECEADHIVVLNYDYAGEPEQRKSISYLSLPDAKIYMNMFDSVVF